MAELFSLETLEAIKDYMSLTKGALDLFKSAYSALPKGSRRDEIEQKVKAATELMARADVKLANDLGYKMCQCTFPPQIMLWREAELVWACPNAKCGAKIDSARRIIKAEEIKSGRRRVRQLARDL